MSNIEPETFALPLLHLESLRNLSTIMSSLLIQRALVTVATDQVKDPRYGQLCYKRVGIVEVLYENYRFESEDEYVQFHQAGKNGVIALVKRVEALETHVVTLIYLPVQLKPHKRKRTLMLIQRTPNFWPRPV